MFITPRSRYRFSEVLTDRQGRTYLGPRERYLYRDFPDNRVHTVKDGDTLHGLAYLYFRPRARAELLWWIIADFQPPNDKSDGGPIQDPTIRLAAGRKLIIPSLRTVEEEILNDRRKRK